MRKLLLFTFWLAATAAWAKDYQVSSPDGLLTVIVHAGQDRLTWEVRHGSTTILTPSEIGINGTLAKLKGKTEGHTVTVRNQQYSVEFRADDDAAAYRITVNGKKPLTIDSETAEFNFADD